MHTTDHLNIALDGKYTIERELGRGGMATVYLAHDVKHDRRVAVKVLHRDLAASIGAERFHSEIKTTASLQHPHILPLFDSGSASTHPDRREGSSFLYYVMPYIAGETVREKLNRETQFSVDEAVRIAREVADALDYAHRHGVVHRDVKPENILLHDGRAMVMDFGIALALRAATGKRITETGLSLGTPHYMSPEQAAAEKDITPRSDVYSLGAVLYEMLTGSPPHTAPTAQQVVMKIIGEEAKPAVTLRRSVPVHVSAAIAKSLEKLAADRFVTAAEFSSALTNASLVSTAEHVPTVRRRSRDPVVWVLAALFVGAVAFGGAQWAAARGAPTDETIRFPIDVPRYVSTGGSIGSSVAITPDGRTIAYIGGNADGSGQQLFVRSVDQVQPTAIPGTENSQALFLSPDGKWLGFWSKGRLFKVSLSGGAPVPLPAIERYNGASWTSRGVILLSANQRFVEIAADASSSAQVKAIDAASDTLGVTTPVVLADGETFLFTTNDPAPDRRMIRAGRRSTGQRVSLGIAGTLPLGVVDGHLVYATSNNRLMAVAFDAKRLRVTGDPFAVGMAAPATPGSVPSAALSASGSLVYQSGLRTSDLVVVDRRGVSRSLGLEPRPYGYPRYSPNGAHIALSIESDASRNVWLFDTSAQTLVQVTDDGASDRPEWTPDAKRLVFRSRGVHSNSAVWWRPVDLSAAATPVFTNGNEDIWEAVVVPDGSALVLQRDALTTTKTGADVMLRPLTGDTTAISIAETTKDETQARVSPDGKWVAYQSTATGVGSQVIVTRLRGASGQIVVSTSAGSEPVWSRDGKHLFYRDGKQLIDAAVTTAPDFVVTSRTPLFADPFLLAGAPHANYDVSPDGQSFLMLRPMQNRQFVFVHNWRAELQRQIAAQRGR